MNSVLKLFKEKNSSEIEKWILDETNDLFACNIHGFTLVHYAAQYNVSRIIQKLYEMGACIHSQNEMGDTPLHLASQYGSYEALKILLEYKVPLDCENVLGNTPLHYASFWNDMDIAKTLLDNGASRFILNANEITAADVRTGEIREEMLKQESASDVKVRNLPDKQRFPEKIKAIDLTRFLLPSNINPDELEIGEMKYSDIHHEVYSGKYRHRVLKLVKLRTLQGSKNVKSYLSSEYRTTRIRNHINIISPAGFTIINKECYLFSYANMGWSLYHLIHESERVIEAGAKLRILQGICSAMQYIHNLTVSMTGFMLSSHHVMVNAQHVPQLDLSKKIYSFQAAVLVHQPQWMAPEALSSSGFTYEGILSDVWSFGVVIWEIVSGKVPYSDILKDKNVSNMIIGHKIVTNQLKLTHLESSEFPYLVRMQVLCNNIIPTRRPTFEELSIVFIKMNI